MFSRSGYPMGIEERVAQIVREQLRTDEDQITRQARFVDDLGANSQDMIKLISRFEEEFAIQIPDEDAEKLETVGDAIAYIETRVQ
jgi:acyl carrier protein